MGSCRWLRVCLGRPHTQPRWPTSTRSQPGQRCTPVCCSRYAESRSDVHTSNTKPSALGPVSSAVSIAPRYATSACTGRPGRGASASASTPPAAKRASQCSTVSLERPLQRAIRSKSSPNAAALTISNRLRIRRVRSVRCSCRSTCARCSVVIAMPPCSSIRAPRPCCCRALPPNLGSA